MKALLQYRNTPLKSSNKSPAQLLLGRKLRDGIPQPKTAYKISPHWQSFARKREKSLAQEKLRSKTYHDSHQVRSYDPLTVGQNVACQNVRNKKWDRTGVVIEVSGFRQYRVKINGSGRISLRNRIHLKPLLHIKPHLPILLNGDLNQSVINQSETSNSGSSSNPQSNERSITEPSSVEQQSLPRRSTRQTREPERYGDWTT